MKNKEPIVKNAVRCGICQSPADRYDNHFECQANPNHVGDLIVGIFSDLTYPSSDLKAPALEHPPLRSLSEAAENEAAARRYWMTTPAHPKKVVDWFLALHHYWFDESLGPNMFTGMRDLAADYLNEWVETGVLPPDNTTLEIYVSMKFQEWLNSSWVTAAPNETSRLKIEALGKSHASLQLNLRFMIRNWYREHEGKDETSSDLTMAESALAESERL